MKDTRSAIDCATPSGFAGADARPGVPLRSTPVCGATPLRGSDAPAPPVRKRSPQAAARRVAIPLGCIVVLAALACCTTIATIDFREVRRLERFHDSISVETAFSDVVESAGTWCSMRTNESCADQHPWSTNGYAVFRPQSVPLRRVTFVPNRLSDDFEPPSLCLLLDSDSNIVAKQYNPPGR